jgi:MarR family transcriptional repressor of emrRAB
MLLTLQPAGEELIQRMLPQITPEVSAAFAGFSAAEKQQLLEGLKRLLAGIDALNAGAEPSQDEST